MKANIIRKEYFVARDENGNEYPLLNFNGKDHEKIEHVNVDGELITETEQDFYTDGTPARSYTEVTYFKISGE